LAKRSQILIAAFEWLTRRDPGVECYEGITGRAYTTKEKDTIALDHGVIANLPCPFHAVDGCMLGGLGPHYNCADEVGHATYGWLPTMVARYLDREQLRDLARMRAIADGKISLLTRNDVFYSHDHSSGRDTVLVT